MSDVRRPGECAACTKPLYAVEQRLAADHPTHPRYPVKLGELIEREAETFHLLLADGRRAELTLCAKCAPKSDDPGFWRAAWARCMRAQADRNPMAKALKPEQIERQRAEIADLANHRPIGVLARSRVTARRGARRVAV